MKHAARSWTRRLDRIGVFLRELHPAKLVVLGYFSYVLLGWLLLCLPFAQRAAEGVRAIDNLFVATSAVTTTGLATVSVSQSYNLFGQAIILLLFQLGGLGFMTFGSFVILSTKGTLSAERESLSKTVFSLPEAFRINKFIKSVVVFTVIMEAIGVAALFPIFHHAQVARPLWSAIFHSVSAFCTAGFGLYDTSFEGFANDLWLNAVIAGLSYSGAVGFIVWVDYWRKFTGRVKQITLTSRIIIRMSFGLSLLGTVAIFAGEPSLEGTSTDSALLISIFQTMTATTTVGFSTINIGALSKGTLLVLMALMVIGASPSGTGGGVKSTTLSALMGIMRSVLRGQSDVRFWGKPVPHGRLWTATASMGFYLLMLLLGTYLLELTERGTFVENLFEATSALGTVGLSMGITASLSNLGKLVVMLLMLGGRIGPLTFGMALFFQPAKLPATSDNDLAV